MIVSLSTLSTTSFSMYTIKQLLNYWSLIQLPTYCCREFDQNLNLWETKNRENTRQRKKNHTHKTIFTWFGNLPTSTELQGFHYYQGRIQSTKLRLQYLFLSPSRIRQPQPTILKNPNHSKVGLYEMGPKNFSWGHCPRTPKGLSMSAPAWAYWPKLPLHELSLNKSLIKNYAILFRSGQVIKQKTRLHKAQQLPK